MAICPLLPVVKVSICVNGIPLEEYEEAFQPQGPNHYRGLRTVSKYVEAVAGSRFSVKAEVGPEYQHDSPTLGFKLVTDGVTFPTMTCKLSDPRTIFPFITDCKGSHEQHSSRADFLKPFIFSAIGVSADDKSRAEIQSETQLMSNVGEIVVEVVRMSESTPMQHSPLDMNIAAPSDIHEKALKGDAKSHGMNLGAREPRHHPGYVSCYDLDADPLAAFTFKYRSREALQQLHVIEPTPEPIQRRMSQPRQTITIKDSPEPESPRRPAPKSNSAILEDLDSNQRIKVERYIQELKRGDQINGGPAVKRERDEEIAPRKEAKRSSEIMMVDLSGGD